MSEKDLIKELFKDRIKECMNKYGIEGCLEVLERYPVKQVRKMLIEIFKEEIKR